MSTVKFYEDDKAKILAALYNASKPLGMGMLHFDPTDMTEAEASELLKETQQFDYLKGRVMKISLESDELNTWAYDRDNGEGAALRVIEKIRIRA